MKIDLKTLSTPELDALMAAARAERFTRKEVHSQQPAHNAVGTKNPAWRCDVHEGNLVFQACDNGFGWVGFVFERISASMLAGAVIANLLSVAAPAEDSSGAQFAHTGPKH